MDTLRTDKNLVVASISLATLFSGSTIRARDGSLITGTLHLPEYQRPYRWGKSQMNALIADLKTHFSAIPKPKHDFYLGSIVLHQDRSSRFLNIIDGQQRLTSMALLCYLTKMKPTPNLKFNAPESHSRIKANLAYLKEEREPFFDLNHINITLVVTRSQDDAYLFFETQNTGGVELSGSDIIKAHHLRSIEPQQRNHFAKEWENMGNLNPLIDTVMKARHWQTLAWKNLSSRLEPDKVRTEIVEELAKKTGKTGQDLIYRQLCLTASNPKQSILTKPNYTMRQPLNSGVNTIHYLSYFYTLHQSLLINQNVPNLEDFYAFYQSMVRNTESSPFLKKLYNSTLLLYVSQFGTAQLLEASLWLFRVVFSTRLSNKKTVREATVQTFVRNHPVLDWIAISFTHQQLLDYLRNFSYIIDPDNLDIVNSVKYRFIVALSKTLNVVVDVSDVNQLKNEFDSLLQSSITKRISTLPNKEIP